MSVSTGQESANWTRTLITIAVVAAAFVGGMVAQKMIGKSDIDKSHVESSVATISGRVLLKSIYDENFKAYGKHGLDPLKGNAVKVGMDCRGYGGYKDINEGKQIALKDATGKLLAIASLSNGHIVETGFSNLCEFKFDFHDVPDMPLYQVEISRRGSLGFSKAELESQGWSISLTLG